MKNGELWRKVDQLRRTHWWPKVETKLGHASVCLVGYPRAVPRDWGDNQGVRPCTITATVNRKTLLQQAQFRHWGIDPVVLAEVRTIDARHGNELRDALKELLLGSSGELQHGWRDVSEPDMVWDMLLGQAVAELGYTDGRQVFGEMEHVRRVIEKARRGGW